MPDAHRPRIVFILNGLAMGGAEAQLLAILEHDRDALARHDVSLLTLTAARHEPFVARLHALGVPIHTIDRANRIFPHFLTDLVRYLRRERPDVVHTFLAGSASTWGRTAALLAGVPTRILSDLSLDPTTTRTHRTLDPWLHRRTTRFLPNAHAIATRLEREGAPPHRIHLLRNGVNLQRFDPTPWTADRITEQRARWGAKPHDTIAGFLGRLHPAKRPDLALEAILALPQDDRPDRLWFAGDGSLRPDLQTRIDQDPWAREHVHLLGVIDDPPAFLAAIDMLLLTSDTEGYPNAVLEAGAMARPVIATRVSDVPHLVDEAWTVPPGDVQALAERIATLTHATLDARRAVATTLHDAVRRQHGLDDATREFWRAHDTLTPPPNPPDVTILLPSLAGGGAERVMLDLLSAFDQQGLRSELVLATRADPQQDGWSERDVPDGIPIRHLDAPRTASAFLPLARYLRTRKPATLLTTLEQTTAIAALARHVAPHVRLVLREANTVEADLAADARSLEGRILAPLLRHAYHQADAIIAVSHGAADALTRSFGVPATRIDVIENPAITPRLEAGANAVPPHPWLEPGQPPTLVTLARLTPQKRLDVLLHAFALTHAHTPSRLLILGDGSERATLETLASRLGITRDVHFTGWVANPFAYLAHAQAFALSSDWEGMPNALIQARALGLPVVATDCPSGTRDVLDDGKEGWLVPCNDPHAMATALNEALTTPRSSPSNAWRARFTLDAAARRYAQHLAPSTTQSTAPRTGKRAEPHTPRPLHILLVTTSLMRGGAENQVVDIALGLRQRGHPVDLVTLRDPEAHEATLRDAHVPVHSLHMQRGRPDPRALLRYARLVRRLKPDVVHAHMVHANLLARLARPLAPTPVLISTAHNVDEGPRWRELAYRLTDPLGTLTTNVAQAGVDRFIRVGATPAHRIEAIPNGLDLNRWAPNPDTRNRLRQELGLGDTFTWLAVGRLEPQKDLPNLLHAAMQAPDGDAPARPHTILIVGEGPLRTDLETLARNLDPNGHALRFLGPRSDVPDLMQAVDGYLLSSAWEGLPLVLLEAAAAGLPIVATDVGGVREIVRTEAMGLVVPPGDPTALAHAMHHVERTDPKRRTAMGRTGRDVVQRHYDLPHVIDTWLARYHALLEPPTHHGGTT